MDNIERLLKEVCLKLDQQTKLLENIQNIFLKYDTELLLENEAIRDE